MCSIYSLQFYVFSICIQVFTLFTYFIYYGTLISSTAKTLSSYDYIIVGSGTAGSLIAHRLASETNFTFVVVEAGGLSMPILDIPAIGPLLHGSIYDWQYETVPQKGACLAMVDQKCRIPQGKITGGSAKLNNMVHVRGNISQYVDWFYGKYNYKYFEEQFEYIEGNILPVNDLQYESALSDAVMEAAHELGYESLNPNSFASGFMKSKVNQKYGKRWSTYQTSSERNYNIITNALVEKLLINKHKDVYGVKYSIMGRSRDIYARKAVILCAGTLNTPKILQLSGIGPSEVLAKHKIQVINDLPVGQNLQDHVTTGLDLILFNKSLNISGADLLNPMNLLEYYLNGKGPLTSPGCEVIGFMSTKKFQNPNIQLMVLPMGIIADKGSHLRKSIGITDVVWNDYFNKILGKQSATILPILLHPKSKGQVFISSKDPNASPIIDPGYLLADEDVDSLIGGLEFVFELVKTDAMKNLEAEINPHKFPGCQDLTFASKPYWECYIRHLTLTSFHPVGTCKMGLADCKNSVVDTEFKVLGVNNLFIADGSVLPELSSGNVNAVIAMMANIFFDVNLRWKGLFKEQKCLKLDFINEILLQMCIVNLNR